MRYSSKALCRKFNQIRKQNWSAPTTMSVFIIICMICIFSLETIGLLNKEKNLNYRLSNSDIIKNNLEENSLNYKELKQDAKKLIEENALKQVTKEEAIKLLEEIILSAANYQISYENSSQNSNMNNFKLIETESNTITIFDV